MIKFVFRWAFRLLLLAIVLVIGLLLLKDTIAKSIAEQRIQRQTGCDVKIGHLELGLLSPHVTIENFVLYNPSEFGGSPFLVIPDLRLEYKPGDFALKGRRLKFLRVELQELNIVEDSKGRTNITELLSIISPGATKPTPLSNKDRHFAGIDLLNLSVGTVRYNNLRKPGRNQEIKLGLKNEIIQNVRSEQDLTAIVFRILLKAGITLYTDHGLVPATNQARLKSG